MDSDSEVHLEELPKCVSLPERSRLFDLTPVGIGTENCEGLVSYLVRLAKAHGISPRLLIKAEFLPKIKEHRAVSHSEFFTDYAKTLHGTGLYAQTFVDLAEALTSRSDLVILTTLPWKEVIPAIGSGFMAKQPRWCKACLGEHRSKAEQCYFRLAWGYALYQVCTEHLVPLASECPWCNRHQPYFPYIPDLSRCSYCYGWLGSGIKGQDFTEQQYWLSKAIGHMVEANQIASSIVTGSAFRKRLYELIHVMADGKKTRFSKMLHMSSSTMKTWVDRRQKPLFPQLLSLCRQLGVMPLELFQSKPVPEVVFENTTIYFRISPKVGKRVSIDVVRQRLHKILNNADDHRPLTEVAIELGVTRKYLLYWFRDIALKLSERHKKHLSEQSRSVRVSQIATVRNLTLGLYLKGEYPSNRIVARLLKPVKISLQEPQIRNVHRRAITEYSESVDRNIFDNS
jgi:hypothetical protein